jgi:hypothetical protein
MKKKLERPKVHLTPLTLPALLTQRYDDFMASKYIMNSIQLIRALYKFKGFDGALLIGKGALRHVRFQPNCMESMGGFWR